MRMSHGKHYAMTSNAGAILTRIKKKLQMIHEHILMKLERESVCFG